MSADKAATGCAAARVAPHATGSSIQTGISCKRAMGASASVQRAAVPVARSITSWTRTARSPRRFSIRILAGLFATYGAGIVGAALNPMSPGNVAR
ncbi:hypothetical protein DA075_34485 [Methylobacterium currus]|uniref:Uncharacterized protein n=1 Tax=Methylobacterium currus TaxID=2051553 RepID=A0A2R4WWJ0_9HYPH|nr:hypothetical protein DA075_34485 [Methylobacterium currus]